VGLVPENKHERPILSQLVEVGRFRQQMRHGGVFAAVGQHPDRLRNRRRYLMTLEDRSWILVALAMFYVTTGDAIGQPDSGTFNLRKVSIIHTSGGKVDAIMSFLRGFHRFGNDYYFDFATFPGSSNLYVTYPDNAEAEYGLREMESVVRALDQAPQEVELTVSVDISYTVNPNVKKVRWNVLSCRARSTGDHTAHFDVSTTGNQAIERRAVIITCSLIGDVKPTVNGDKTVTLDASGKLVIAYRLPGDKLDRHLRTSLSYFGRHNFGNTVVLSVATLKIPKPGSSDHEVEATVSATPNKPAKIQPPISTGNN
jgi:hypothetical protein